MRWAEGWEHSCAYIAYDVGGDDRFGLLLYCFLILDTRGHTRTGQLEPAEAKGLNF